ncbi:MAG TPA: hypothetical protein PKX94_03315 [Opitutales bacterium]|nr:hypothetical protein [Opitutales bacterium]HOO92471.1 hypothetical protein [Opitutales bacterium]
MIASIYSYLVAYATWKDLANDQETLKKIALGLGIMIFLILMRKLNKILVIFGLVIIFAFYWVFHNPDALEQYADYEDPTLQFGSKF